MSVLLTTVGAWAPTILAWMIATLAVSSLLTVVALLLHRLARGVAPSRVVWGVALFTAVALSLSQPWRRAEQVSPVRVRPLVSTAAIGTSTIQVSARERAIASLRNVGAVATATLRRSVVGTSQRVARAALPIKVALVLLWPVATIALLGLGVWTYRRQRLLLRDAHEAELAGHTVYVSVNAGPAVYGVRAPRIVVPAWLLERTPNEQQLVLTHEQAHIRAGDPALLVIACVATALVPWNPFVWYLLSRLRLAIELDCDARVLAAGATARHYGALLIDLSAASPAPLLSGATAFSHHTSHLERRLRRMTDRPATHIGARRFGSLTIAALALIAACGAELPTSAEIQSMNVASAEKRAFVAMGDSAALYFVVDGKQVGADEARAIGADRIASITVKKLEKGRREVFVATKAADSTTNPTGATSVDRSMLLVAKRSGVGSGESSYKLSGDSIRYTSAKRGFDGIILADGVRITESDLEKIAPDRVHSVEVVKGSAATKRFGPDGINGAIIITTKK